MMYHPNEVARRARVASFALMGVFFILGAAFFRTQIINHERYALLSDANRLRGIPIPAQRGAILDRNNQIIAEDVPGYSVSLVSESVDSLRAALARFSALVPLTPKEIERATNPKTFSIMMPTLIMSDATFAQVALLKEHQVVDFPGLLIEATPKRHYPDGKKVAAFTGYMREITEADSTLPRFETYRRGAQVGAMGLEEQYEDLLAGIDGRKWIEVNATNNFVVREQGVRPILEPEKGNDLHTNTDLDLQRFIADSVFGEKWVGGVLVMNPVTGEVLALHSAPSFDPNDFIGGISFAKYDSLRNDTRLPMYNKVTKGLYPPASTFKLAIAILGLEAGMVSLDERMRTPCTGYIMVGNRRFHCWKAEGHGAATLSEAIQGSCNVYFFQLGQRLGFAKLLAGGVDLGFMARSGIDLPGELQPVFIPNTDYYDKRYGPTGWTAESETVNLAIGQGAVTQTVANMAKFYSALASDGYAVRPQLIRGTPTERKQIFRLTPEQSLGVRQALASVVTSGTAAASRIQGLSVAGKTGTAQNTQGNKVSHGWFVGFAPVEKPQLLVAILIEHGLHGSTAALEAKKIFARYFKDSTVRLGEIGG